MVRGRVRVFCGWMLWFAAVAALTVLTETGGLLLVLATVPAVIAARRWNLPRQRRNLATAGLFVALYGLSLAVVPPLAAATGRVALPCFATAEMPLGALTPLTCLLHRRYATPQVKDGLAALADAMTAAGPETETRYLDAGFPFGLLPLLEGSLISPEALVLTSSSIGSLSAGVSLGVALDIVSNGCFTYSQRFFER